MLSVAAILSNFVVGSGINPLLVSAGVFIIKIEFKWGLQVYC
jgi:hypothetical protein